MAQIKTFSWTNPATAVARNLDVGFTVSEITTIDTTNGGAWYWVVGMNDASYIDLADATTAAANGFTPLAQDAMFGALVTAFSNANPGVITATNISQAGIAAGDVIKVTGIADDASDGTLNSEYTVASVTTTAITTTTNTTNFSVYVSGGYVTSIADSSGNAKPTDNTAIRGITIGTAVVGADSAAMVAIVKGENSVT